MSLHILAKKTKALRGASKGKRFAQYMTGSRIGGRTILKPPPPGLRRNQKACCPMPTINKPHIDDVLVPKAPIKQMGYGIYLKSRTGSNGPGLLAGRLTSKTVGPNHQSTSLYTELKRLETLKQPACCPTEREVTLDQDGNITKGPSEFVYGCHYDFTWTSGHIKKIHGKNVSTQTSATINICGVCINQLIIEAENGSKTTFPIVDKPAKSCRAPTRQTCCGVAVKKNCGCTTCNKCLTSYKVDKFGRSWSTKKMRAGYVRMLDQNACCTTTKDMSCMSSGDYISRLKTKKSCPCNNPPQKRVCGGGGGSC